MNTNRRKIFAWALYDWASSAFPTIVTTFIFATYFTSQVAINKIVGTFQWANASALAGIIIAIASPIFGAIADYSGYHKKWLMIFTVFSAFFSSLLWFVYPQPSSVYVALTCVVLGTVTLEIAVVFYNALLPKIAPPDYIGRISGWAWGLGYFGGIVALAIALGIIHFFPVWFNTSLTTAIRYCGPLVGAWFILFSLPLFFLLTDTPGSALTLSKAIRQGLGELFSTLQSLPQQKNLLVYLIAHLIYIDGLNTLFAFGGIYAAGTFNMSLTEIIFFGITMNISAGIGAILLAWLDDFVGSKITILLSLVCLTIFGIPLLFVQTAFAFWTVALLLTLFVGPVQAASRSLMARLTPPQKATEFFGLYSFSGKISSFLGPWLLGMATIYFGTQRAGMATILIFFIVGGMILLKVKETNRRN